VPYSLAERHARHVLKLHERARLGGSEVRLVDQMNYTQNKPE
jgi:hypothetical protein